MTDQIADLLNASIDRAAARLLAEATALVLTA